MRRRMIVIALCAGLLALTALSVAEAAPARGSTANIWARHVGPRAMVSSWPTWNVDVCVPRRHHRRPAIRWAPGWRWFVRRPHGRVWRYGRRPGWIRRWRRLMRRRRFGAHRHQRVRPRIRRRHLRRRFRRGFRRRRRRGSWRGRRGGRDRRRRAQPDVRRRHRNRRGGRRHERKGLGRRRMRRRYRGRRDD
jgi:hypothetical protein